MEIAFIIVAGITLISIFGMVADSLTKTKIARLSTDPKLGQGLQQRIADLEKKVFDQEAKILLLEDNISFTTKLLEDRKK